MRDAGGDVGVHEGGLSTKPSPYALKLYGADPAIKRVPLSNVQAAEVVKLNIARGYAHDVLARAERAAKGNPKVMLGILAQMADALSDAADMLRMRISRLEKQ